VHVINSIILPELNVIAFSVNIKVLNLICWIMDLY